MLHASVLKVTLSSFLCVFLTGEFQPKPSLLGDNSSSGQERDQFADGTDALHSGFMNYIKVRWCGSTHIPLLGTLKFRFKDFSPTFQSPFTVCSGSLQHVCVWQWELAPTLLVSEWFGVYICFSLVSFSFFFLSDSGIAQLLLPHQASQVSSLTRIITMLICKSSKSLYFPHHVLCDYFLRAPAEQPFTL